MTRTIVAVESAPSYPQTPPFHPSSVYPEYAGKETSDEPNPAYEGVRNLLARLGMDQEHFGTPEWNPLGKQVSPGQTVFIKPNLVDHKHRFDEDVWSVITHPSVVRAVADYVAIALKGEGKIIIGDNPHVDTQWEELEKIWHFNALQEDFQARHPGIEWEIMDCRLWHMPNLKFYGFMEGREALGGDPKGVCNINLGTKSLLYRTPFWLLRGTYNERLETIRHHFGRRHEYVFSNSIFTADTYISIPKLKAHSKVGATLNLKGLIGTIANKNTLVHWRIGYPRFGGDEYPTPRRLRDYPKLYWQHLLMDCIPGKIYFRLRNYLNKTRIGARYNSLVKTEYQHKRMLRGAWDGNDTTWRMTVDVYQAFVRDAGGYREENHCPQRTFSIVDGIMGGDTDGPHFPHPTSPGVLIGGEDLLAVDVVSVRMMDYDGTVIPYLNHLAQETQTTLTDIEIRSEALEQKDFETPEKSILGYRPPHRWPTLSLQKLEPGPSFLPR